MFSRQGWKDKSSLSRSRACFGGALLETFVAARREEGAWVAWDGGSGWPGWVRCYLFLSLSPALDSDSCHIVLFLQLQSIESSWFNTGFYYSGSHNHNHSTISPPQRIKAVKRTSCFPSGSLVCSMISKYNLRAPLLFVDNSARVGRFPEAAAPKFPDQLL